MFFRVDLPRSGHKIESTPRNHQDTDPFRTLQTPTGARREIEGPMNSKSDQHDREHLDLVFLYGLQALPLSEIPVVEAHISSCPECRQEIETLRPIIGSFVSWPTDVLRPSVSLWGRLTQRIAEETGKEPVLPPSQLPAKPEWEEVAPGISSKLLEIDTEKNRVSMLVRLARGAASPPPPLPAAYKLHPRHATLL